jgi:hypothetical protein
MTFIVADTFFILLLKLLSVSVILLEKAYRYKMYI